MSGQSAEAAALGSSYGASTVSSVVYTELRIRSSRPRLANKATPAATSPASPNSCSTSSDSCKFVHRTTSPLDRPPVADATTTAARNSAAAETRHAHSDNPPLDGVLSTNQADI